MERRQGIIRLVTAAFLFASTLGWAAIHTPTPEELARETTDGLLARLWSCDTPTEARKEIARLLARNGENVRLRTDLSFVSHCLDRDTLPKCLSELKRKCHKKMRRFLFGLENGTEKEAPYLFVLPSSAWQIPLKRRLGRGLSRGGGCFSSRMASSFSNGSSISPS